MSWLNRHSIGFRIGFWSGLTLVVLGVAITTYAELRMSELAGAQRAESIESARQLILNTAEEQAGAIDAMIAEPLSATRTLAQAFVSAARKEVSELTEQDWVRLRSRFKRMEKVSEVAVSSLRPLIEAAERGELTLEEAQGQALERLRAMRYDGENYFWVQDRAAPYPRMIMHPFAPELEGRVMDDPRYNNAMGRDENFFVALDAIAAREGKGYIHYAWPRPGETEPTPKLAFGQLIPEWDWVVASGMWIDRMSFYTRNDIDLILRSVLRENPGFLAVYTAWEPNAFDGRDSDFVNAPGSDASGRFISYWSRGASGAIELEPLVDYETPGAGDYYMLPKQRGLEQLINPYLYPVQGREVLITSLVAPIVMGGEFRGIAGVDLSLEPFQRFVEEAARRLYGGRAQVAIIAHDGTLVGLSADAGQVGQPHADAETLRAALQGGEPLVMEQGDRMVAVAPIRPGKTDTPWAIQISVPTEVITALADEASTTARRVGLVMALVSVACVLAGIGLMFWVTRGIVRRLASVVRTMHDIAEGEGDLTRELDARGRDELADLAGAFNRFQTRIRELVKRLGASSERMAAAAEELSATSAETSEQVRRQQVETEQVATSMNEMSATVADMARNAAAAAEAAQQADGEASSGREVVERAIASIQAQARQAEEAAETVARLSDDSFEIGKVLDVIRAIAEQTNLLALNAAIEAARAGEQGRGFAVVADEVRTLASRTQASTKEIHAMIERLQSGAGAAVSAMDAGRQQAQQSAKLAGEAGQSLESITRSVTTMRDMNHQIASATEEQAAVAHEVDRNLISSAQEIEGIAEGSTQISAAARELAQLAAEQQQQVGQFKV